MAARDLWLNQLLPIIQIADAGKDVGAEDNTAPVTRAGTFRGDSHHG